MERCWRLLFGPGQRFAIDVAAESDKVIARLQIATLSPAPIALRTGEPSGFEGRISGRRFKLSLGGGWAVPILVGTVEASEGERADGDATRIQGRVRLSVLSQISILIAPVLFVVASGLHSGLLLGALSLIATAAVLTFTEHRLMSRSLALLRHVAAGTASS